MKSLSYAWFFFFLVDSKSFIQTPHEKLERYLLTNLAGKARTLTQVGNTLWRGEGRDSMYDVTLVDQRTEAADDSMIVGNYSNYLFYEYYTFSDISIIWMRIENKEATKYSK